MFSTKAPRTKLLSSTCNSSKNNPKKKDSTELLKNITLLEIMNTGEKCTKVQYKNNLTILVWNICTLYFVSRMGWTVLVRFYLGDILNNIWNITSKTEKPEFNIFY